MAEEKYPQGKNPRSLANLRGGGAGRPSKYGKRNKHEIPMTDEGWQGIKSLALACGCSSVSDLLEQLARNELGDRLLIEQTKRKAAQGES